MKNVACSLKGSFSNPPFSVARTEFHFLISSLGCWWPPSLQRTHLNPEGRGRTFLWNIGICLPTQLLASQSEHSVPRKPQKTCLYVRILLVLFKAVLFWGLSAKVFIVSNYVSGVHKFFVNCFTLPQYSLCGQLIQLTNHHQISQPIHFICIYVIIL
jgi:hypothetical protein